MKKKPELPNVEPVKIKPLFGIKPEIWVSTAYLIAIVAIIFIVGFLPGIIHGSKRVSFDGPVNNSAVYVDGNYAGGTPFTKKIESGTHVVEYKINGISLDGFEIEVGHPVFFSWLFPRKMNVVSTKGLNYESFREITVSFLNDVANYSSITSYDEVYIYPPLFRNYAENISTYTELSREETEKILKCAFAFITTEEMLGDAKQACNILGFDYDFRDTEKAVDSGNFKSETKKLIGLSRIYSDSISVFGLNIDGTSVNGYTMANTCVSEALFYYFVQENPFWSAENVDELTEKGLADEYYLTGVSLSPANTQRPVRNISYHAAEAFCSWLSEKTGKNVFIPSELQWTTAANISGSGFQKTLVPAASEQGPSGVLGSVWEMTSTPYVPLESLFDNTIYKTLEDYGISCEVIIKGGCYLSDSARITTYSIGTSPLELCSDYMGFRFAWR